MDICARSEEAQQIWWEIEEIVGGYGSSKLVLEGTCPDGGWILPDIYTSFGTG